MGSRARNFVLEHRRAGGFAQAVLAYLADCMNDQTGRCYPSREKIAEYFSAPDEPCTVKRVERALARLRALGFISSVRVPYSRQTDTRKEGGWHNAYTLVGFETGVTSASDVTPKTYVTPTMERGHPQNVQGVTPNLERGHPQNRGINQKEPEENQKEPVSSMRTSGKTSAIAVASAQAQTPYPEDFDQSLFDEAMLATQDSEQAPEALPDPDADLPPKKQRRSQQPRVPFPETLPDDWAEAAKIDVGSKPNTVKAEAPKHRTTTPRKKPATRCPFDAEALIPDDYRQIAEKAGIGDPQRVFSTFVNHALAHDRRLVIWPAGFRTWCSNELKWHPDQKPKPKPLHQRTADDYNW